MGLFSVTAASCPAMHMQTLGAVCLHPGEQCCDVTFLTINVLAMTHYGVWNEKCYSIGGFL